MDSLDWETCRNEMAICRQLWYIYQQRETVNQDRVWLMNSTLNAIQNLLDNQPSLEAEQNLSTLVNFLKLVVQTLNNVTDYLLNVYFVQKIECKNTHSFKTYFPKYKSVIQNSKFENILFETLY